MSQVADDLSVAWYQACDLIRSRLPGLAANHSVWLLPSLESALFEVSQVLVDRNAEMGGAKSKALFVRGQDPSFEVLASALSSSGLDTRFCSMDEFRTPATSFDPIKSEALFVAYAANSRFTGEVFDLTAPRAHILASGSKAALLRVGFEQKFDETVKPEPWEISINVLWSGASVVVLGERFRVSPKTALYQMPRGLIENVVREFMDVSSGVAVKSLATGGAGLGSMVEAFEAKLPKPFRALHATGVPRLQDRAIFTSEELDGSWVCEKLEAESSKAVGASVGTTVGTSVAATAGFSCATTSGCWDAEAFLKRADERRQDWLRNNRRVWTSDLDIRGTIQIPLKSLVTMTPEKLLLLLESVVSSHK